MIEGGCFCRFIRYRVSGTPYHETLCHCLDCRRVAAAPMVGWFTAKRADVILRGALRLFRSSPAVKRGFCPTCGTMLTYAHAELPDEIDVAIGSLDDPGTIQPRDHVWVSQKLPWMVIGDGLPQFPKGRAD